MVYTFYRLRLNDKAVFTGHVTGSFVCGSAVLIPLAGLLCEYGFDGGWPSVFYVFGLYSLFHRQVSWTERLSRLSHQTTINTKTNTTTAHSSRQPRDHRPSIKTRISADADNRRDAFSGQSSQQTWYHFWVRCDFSLSV